MDLNAAVEVVRGGGLVGMPTETVYGLAASASNASAVAAVFEAKGRPRFDPLIVHAASASAAWALVGPQRVDAVSRRLGEAFWPGPLTLVLPRPAAVPTLVTAGLDTVGVRVPAHRLALALIERAGPVAAPSANPFGGVSPTRAEHVCLRHRGEAVGVLDGGPCTTGVESTVVRVVSAEEVVVLRPGGVPLERLAEVVGSGSAGSTVSVRLAGEADRVGGLASPGMTQSHYAPAVPVRFVEVGEPVPAPPGPGWVLLTAGPLAAPAGYAGHEVLSAPGELSEAAARLFDTLHRLDDGGSVAGVVAGVVAVAAPPVGIGLAINDRLRRAGA